MWDVLVAKSADKALAKAPLEIRENWDAWFALVRKSGPDGLRAVKGFHDESLRGDRKGQRSSRLSRKWRVIYKVQREEITVLVLEVNAHDY